MQFMDFIADGVYPLVVFGASPSSSAAGTSRAAYTCGMVSGDSDTDTIEKLWEKLNSPILISLSFLLV
jgi:hypothetical protein